MCCYKSSVINIVSIFQPSHKILILAAGLLVYIFYIFLILFNLRLKQLRRYLILNVNHCAHLSCYLFVSALTFRASIICWLIKYLRQNKSAATFSVPAHQIWMFSEISDSKLKFRVLNCCLDKIFDFTLYFGNLWQTLMNTNHSWNLDC